MLKQLIWKIEGQILSSDYELSLKNENVGCAYESLFIFCLFNMYYKL